MSHNKKFCGKRDLFNILRISERCTAYINSSAAICKVLSKLKFPTVTQPCESLSWYTEFHGTPIWENTE